MKRTWAAFAALIATGMLIAGCTTTANNKAPTAKFVVDKSVWFVGGTPDFNASQSKDPDGKVKSYIWNFGDGSGEQTITDKETTHTFSTAGTFNVSLVVKDDKGAKSKPNSTMIVVAPLPGASTQTTDTASNINFTLDTSNLGGLITDYAWNFGDGGNVVKGASVSHAYVDNGNYTVMLTITYNSQAASSNLNVVIQDRPPVANISISAIVPYYSNKPIGFTGAASGDPDGNITKWYWEFSDNTTDNGSTVTHTFGTPGTFNVKLTVTDNDNGTGTATIPITIVQDLKITNVTIDTYRDIHNLPRADLTILFDNLGDAKAANTVNITVKSYESNKSSLIDTQSKVFDAPIASNTKNATATIVYLLVSNIDPATTQYFVMLTYNNNIIDSGWYPL